MKNKFLKFLLVGIVNTLFGTTIMLLAYNLFNLSYWISSALNYFLGSILSFFLNKYFTFQTKERKPSEILKFIFNIIFCYIFSYVFAKKIIESLVKDAPIAVIENSSMLLGMIIFVLLNFIGQKYWVFKSETIRV